MKERTYRYFTGKALHPFGFGLSYTNFSYTDLSVTKSNNDFTCSLKITNTGQLDGDEVVQLYLRRINKNENEPLKTLKGFKRISIKKRKHKKSFVPVNQERHAILG